MNSKIVAIGIIGFVAVAGWQLGERLSAPAILAAMGVIFGATVAIPIALIALEGEKNV